MATILEKANEILAEKDNKILPENLKAGVSFFDVNGTLVELVGETKVITPTTEIQNILPSDGYNGITSVTVNAVDATIDTNIVAENIKEGTTILGVTGNLTSGIDTSDATATAEDIVYGKTAYINGEKVTGNIDISRDIQNMWNDDDPWGDGSIHTANFNNVPCLVIANHFKVSEDTDIKMLITSKVDGTGTVIESIAPTENVSESIGLTADKIVEGNTILGIEGTAKTGGIDTSDATATSADLINPKTAYVNGEKVVGNINKSTADAIIGTSDNTVEEFRTNILNALSGHMNADESGLNYTLYPQKYGTGDTSLDKPVTIYFVYDNPEESCYDIIAIMTGNWDIKRNSNAGWNASVSRTEHHVTTTSGTDWRHGVWFYHYRVNYSFEFVSKVTKSKDKTAAWGNQSMNVLFGINSCLYENLLLVSPNYLNRMISNASSFAIYKDRAGKSSYPSLNEELNLILNEKNTKLIPENIKKDVTILNVTGTLEQGVDTSDATATTNDLAAGTTAYVNGQKIEGTLSIISDGTTYGNGWFNELSYDGMNIVFRITRGSSTADVIVKQRCYNTRINK